MSLGSPSPANVIKYSKVAFIASNHLKVRIYLSVNTRVQVEHLDFPKLLVAKGRIRAVALDSIGMVLLGTDVTLCFYLREAFLNMK